jgi:translation elongation factor EF-Ts
MAKPECAVCSEKTENLEDGICQVCLTIAACHPSKAKRYQLNQQVNSRTRHRIKALAEAQKWNSR